MSYEAIILERDGHVARITLNRPEKLNAINDIMMRELAAAWRFATNLHALSAIQRPGRSIINRGEFNFYDIRDEKGLKAAIAERDDPFNKYFPQPKSRQ